MIVIENIDLLQRCGEHLLRGPASRWEETSRRIFQADHCPPKPPMRQRSQELAFTKAPLPSSHSLRMPRRSFDGPDFGLSTSSAESSAAELPARLHLPEQNTVLSRTA